MHPYRNFALMILVSSTVMHGLMYLNTYEVSHVWFSQTRLFMTFIMAGSMSLVMMCCKAFIYRMMLMRSTVLSAPEVTSRK